MDDLVIWLRQSKRYSDLIFELPINRAYFIINFIA